jgi:carboxyl-terminal processing protease
MIIKMLVMGLWGFAHCAVVAGCSETSDTNGRDTVDPDSETDSDTEQDPFQGYWMTHGYGMAMEAADGVVKLYRLTSMSCIPWYEGPYEGLYLPEFEISILMEDEDNLVLQNRMTLYYTASRVEALPSLCDGGGTEMSQDPELAFEVFWHTFDEHYAFFELREVDWLAAYEEQRSRVTSETTPDELFGVLCEMVAPLNDGHVAIYQSETKSCSSKPMPSWLEGDKAESFISYLLDSYLSGKDVTTTGNGLIAYRLLSDHIGYVSILQMSGFGETQEEELATAAAAIDEVVDAFADLDAIVIDVRFNDGGHDGISLVLASRFADKTRLAFSKQARDGDSYTPLRSYEVSPDGPAQFTKEVVLLTSEFTASAAEIFAMAMGEMPHVTLIGEPTDGGHSDMLQGMLPNGFVFFLSNERYTANDGVCYEGAGVPPDIEIAFDPEAFLQGDDTMLEKAVQYLSSK